MLSFYKFPGDEIPIIRGSALSALQGTNDEIGRKAILKLMDAVDAYIPDPVRVLDKPFLMPIEDVFSIQVITSVVSLEYIEFPFSFYFGLTGFWCSKDMLHFKFSCSILFTGKLVGC